MKIICFFNIQIFVRKIFNKHLQVYETVHKIQPTYWVHFARTAGQEKANEVDSSLDSQPEAAGLYRYHGQVLWLNWSARPVSDFTRPLHRGRGVGIEPCFCRRVGTVLQYLRADPNPKIITRTLVPRHINTIQNTQTNIWSKLTKSDGP